MLKRKPVVVVSLGGSVLAPGPKISQGQIVDPSFVDRSFLSAFSLLIQELTQRRRRFIITVGGGKVNSNYVEVIRKMGIDDNFLLDTLGISSTRFNATLLWTILKHVGLAYRQVVENPTIAIQTTKPVIIGCGWKPGCSTDKDAVLWALTAGAKVVINASNISHVYDRDPNQFPHEARPIDAITWPDFRKMVGNKWQARMNAPFDPIAAQIAQANNIKVFVLDGRNIANLRAAIEEEKFIGTTIG